MGVLRAGSTPLLAVAALLASAVLSSAAKCKTKTCADGMACCNNAGNETCFDNATDMCCAEPGDMPKPVKVRTPVCPRAGFQCCTGMPEFGCFSNESMCPISDRRLKRDVRRVGATPSGIPLYHFRYATPRAVSECGLRTGAVVEGVMAQDLLRIRPDAVSVGADGFYRVDYSRVDVPPGRAQG